MFEKVLIANRGEIAIRVARTLKEMGIGSVAVYSEIDRDAPHVREADEAFLIGPAVPAESYLNVVKIIETAKEAGAEAIHPGYGFLAENADFARACAEAGNRLRRPARRRRSKRWARRRGRGRSWPRPGCRSSPARPSRRRTSSAARQQAEDAGYPVACKAAGGGGGKGFRVAMTPDDLEEAFEGAAREGEKFFSDDRVYVERYLEDPRHVEVQVLADSHGNVIHLGERDCSIQRRHQKVIEEAPGPHVDAEMRERIGKIATDAAAAVGYRGAGTVEGHAGRRRVLLPRDEHPGPGRALRDRDGHRRSTSSASRSWSPPARRSRSPRSDVELRGPRDRVPDQRRGGPQELRAGAGSDHHLPRAGRARRARRLRGRGRLRGDADVRPDGRQADRLGRRPRARDAAHAAGARTSTRSAA